MKKDNTHIWSSEEKIKYTGDPFATKTQQEGAGSKAILKLVEMGAEAKDDNGVPLDGAIPVELKGESFHPLENFGVLALVDVTRSVKRIRRIPAFLHINKPVTKIGNGKRADFKVDDFESVRSQHGAIVFKNGHFHIFPQEGSVVVNGKEVSEEGEVLKSGSKIEMGSAKFIFLMV